MIEVYVGFSFFRDQTDISAVCVFSLSDISKAMEGPFKELKKNCENWINHEPVPTPRPGQVLKPIFNYVYKCNVTAENCTFYINILSSHPLVFKQCLQG